MSIQDEIEETKKKLRETPVNKSTETERGRLKSKIARLKQKKEKKEKESGAAGQGYAVKQRGDTTVALVGPPSVGKSTLLNKLTNADSEVASYDFTTLDVVPGTMDLKGAKIQLLDVPGLISGAAEDRGGGKQVISVIRNCDLLLMLVDEDKINYLERINEELYESGIRLNRSPPDIKVEKKSKGGIQVSKPPWLDLGEETIKKVMEDNGFLNCKIIIREDVTLDEVIDAVMKNRVYMPGVVCVNKIDSISDEKHKGLVEENSDYVFISAKEEENLDVLKERLWKELGLMRVYMKKRDKEPDRDEPLVVDRGSTVAGVIESLDKNFKGELRFAKVWGPSSKFPGQKVGEDHALEDEDILELRF